MTEIGETVTTEQVFDTEFGGDFAKKPCNFFRLYLLETIVRIIFGQNGGT